MKQYLMVATAAACAVLATLVGAQAADPVRGEPVEITVQLGTAGGDLVMSPRDLSFEVGKYYKLVLKNPSDVEHRLAVADFASSVRTYGKPTIDRGEVVGRAALKSRVPIGYLPRGIDIAPGGVAEWYFVPVFRSSAKVGCTRDSHAEAGMVGTFEVI